MAEQGDTENRLMGEGREVPVFCTIEEHAAALGLSAAVFAAVRQYQGWAAGKKVEKGVFEQAVHAFLGAPMGGT
jgi:hypothetical protein